MEDCFTVRVQQLRTLYHQRCCMSASRLMFGSLWNAAAAHEHRRQDGSRRPGTTANCQTTTGGRTCTICSGRAGALVASVADGALVIYGRSVEYRSPDGQRRAEPTAAGSSVLKRCRRTASCSSQGGRKRTPGLMSCIWRQQPDSLPQLVVAALTDRSDVSRQWQLAVDDDAEVTSCKTSTSMGSLLPN